VADREPDRPAVLRRQPASPGPGHPDDHPGTCGVACGACGDDPGPDDPGVASGLRPIRGPYPPAAGIAGFAEHGEYHDTAGQTDQTACRRGPGQRARPDGARGGPLTRRSRAGAGAGVRNGYRPVRAPDRGNASRADRSAV